MLYGASDLFFTFFTIFMCFYVWTNHSGESSKVKVDTDAIIRKQSFTLQSVLKSFV